MIIFVDVARLLFSGIDGAIYWFFKVVYNLMYEIANTSLCNTTDAGSIAGDFGRRIYTIIGVIMLFKMAISIVGYIVDPDQLDNKDKGFGGLIKNVVIVIGLILVVPFVFKYAMKLQYAILADDTIGRLVTGVSHAGTTSYSSSVGNKIAFGILSGFITPNDNITDCKDIFVGTDATSCINAIKTIDSTLGSDYESAITNNDVGKLLEIARGNDDFTPSGSSSKEYIFEYHILLSSLVGGFAAYIILLFCIDIAVRSVKLVFLQMIAPLPIVSYIDTKGQQGVFKKWVSNCTSTYLDLFVRLAVIDLAIYMIENIILNGNLTYFTYDTSGQAVANQPGAFTKIFIMLGMLMFAKQLPKLIEDITGVKLGGDFSLNPAKKLTSVPLVGAAIGAGIGAMDSKIHGGSLIAGASRGWKNVGFGGSGKTFKDLTPTAQKFKEAREKNREKGIDQRLKAIEGQREYNDINDQWQNGEKERRDLAQKFVGRTDKNGKPITKDNVFSLFDGKEKNMDVYTSTYKNKEFVNSKFAVDRQDAKNKALQAKINQAQAQGNVDNLYKEDGSKYADIQELYNEAKK